MKYHKELRDSLLAMLNQQDREHYILCLVKVKYSWPEVHHDAHYSNENYAHILKLSGIN